VLVIGAADGGAVESGGVVHQDVQTLPGIIGFLGQGGERVVCQQIGLHQDHGILPDRVEVFLQCLSRRAGTQVMEDDIEARRVKVARGNGPDTVGRAGNEYDLLVCHSMLSLAYDLPCSATVTQFR